ncbi:glutathione S-transferase II [Niveomyces insectorum RCEF 264]|uniref:Glutathione S-transferase II n=1 Tax=Niveomyces insectorum RCEF 264 TaxID=1081102 RepID=A0A167U2H6_9HYPO|nr:glutathione S-transferase II [Niveomyces insectorum RCEF 264]
MALHRLGRCSRITNTLLRPRPPAFLPAISTFSTFAAAAAARTAAALCSTASRPRRPSASPPPQQPQPARRALYATMAASKPAGLKASSGLELLTYGASPVCRNVATWFSLPLPNPTPKLTHPATPNNYKVSVLLEELRDAYGLDYTVQLVDLGQRVQKEPWYVRLNPNGRIPTLYDHDARGGRGLAVFESVAILAYLVRRFDTDHRFSFDPRTAPDELAVAESWIAWQQGGLGPMQGQASYFLRMATAAAAAAAAPGAETDNGFALQRYVGEAERLYGVLDARLAGEGEENDGRRDYVAGHGRGRYTTADMALLGWASVAQASGVDVGRRRRAGSRCRGRTRWQTATGRSGWQRRRRRPRKRRSWTCWPRRRRSTATSTSRRRKEDSRV